MGKKWEYMFVRGAYVGNVLCPRYINGHDVRDPGLRAHSFYDFANQLGEQGWELISADLDNERFVFKRPKTEQEPTELRWIEPVRARVAV